MALVSVAARNASLAMSYGALKGSSAPDSLEVALFDGDPANGGTELSGGGYARVTVPNDATTWPDAPDGGQIVAAPIDFPAASGAWAEAADYFQLYDADTGDEWDSGELSSEAIALGAGFVVRLPDLTVYYSVLGA